MHTSPDCQSETVGFLLDCFDGWTGGKPAVFAIGRLRDGRTFGVVETRVTPEFSIREADRDRIGSLPQRKGCTVESSPNTSMHGESLLVVKCPDLRTQRRLADQLGEAGIHTFEGDLAPHRRFRIERGLTGAIRLRGTPRKGHEVDVVYLDPDVEPADWEPALSLLCLDIETTRDAGMVTAVSLVMADEEEVHVLSDGDDHSEENLRGHQDETVLLRAVAARIREMDPDLISGWNVVDFDLRVLLERFNALGVPPLLGRSSQPATYRSSETYGRSHAVVRGRQVIDAMQLARHIPRRFDDYRLETVAQAVLGRGKLLEAGEGQDIVAAIERARREDPALFAEYCLEDARLVRDLLAKEKLMTLNLRRSILTGLPLDRAWGSVAALDFLYIHELHQRGMRAPTAGEQEPGSGAPGGLVLEAKAGLYHNIFIFDFKSLYPSVMRTFNIGPWTQDPHGEIEAPNGVRFRREPGILTSILDVFFERREQAKREDDETASFTYKIVMNSFYGVLGTSSCRFGRGELAGAITSFGQHLLRWCRDWLEAHGCTVIYGDTDSLFVDAAEPLGTSPEALQKRGQQIGDDINRALDEYVTLTYGIPSRLDLEFEKIYLHFLMPPSRGDVTKGRAKGYAGLRLMEGETEPKLDIVGMEAVRSDWTEMAHRLQRELLTRLFRGDPGPAQEIFISDWVRDLKAGEMDADLVYHRRLRKALDSYTKTTPPHVKAARMMDNPGGTIHYVVTTAGPQPASMQSAPLDYEHYVAKQVLPLVRIVAPYADVDPNAAVHGELRLF
ncbi:MAG: DNA polymerase II [Lentisphaeria bacterium]|nr:DNA polymerase II [Lentisphaeria bacterium]